MEDRSFCSIPRVVLAAPHGRSGKTTAALALASAITGRGLIVQPFKKGPDYIDPSWLSAAVRRPTRNLDPFLMDPEVLQATLARSGAGADLVLIEGNHGLYDAIDDQPEGSTAAIARLLQAPIILVVDAARMGRSIAALIQGYQRFEPGTPIVGVILNNVAQARHQEKLGTAIEKHCGLPVLGVLPRDANLSIPDRHLGLIPEHEYGLRAAAPLAALRRVAEDSFDIDAILALARRAPPFPSAATRPQVHPVSCRIGVVRDSAFSFYYPENLEALAFAGADLVWINSLKDIHLPVVDALYIGGGFPEAFMEPLEANAPLRNEIRTALEAGLPAYAECGGLMYLSRELRWGKRRAEMVGALNCSVELLDSPQGHGYVQATVTERNPFFPVGAALRGHEYHHSRVVGADVETAYSLSRGRGVGGARDGIVYRRVLASYTHLHALGSPEWASGLVAAALSQSLPSAVTSSW